MSTTEKGRGTAVPPLVAGERLDRATFHERYEAMPPGTRAELIGGKVVMPSPVSRGHGFLVSTLGLWLGHYRKGVPGLYSGNDATVYLDDRAEVQPDLQLHIRPEFGGRTRVQGQYIAGAPELVVEVAHSSERTDLTEKREDYRRAGVLEYLVVTLEPEGVHWFHRRGDRLDEGAPGPDGLYRSEAFPGLWLDPPALFADDLERLSAAVDRGKATPEHAAFAARLAARAPG